MDKLIQILLILFILYVVWQIQKNNLIDSSVETFFGAFEHGYRADGIMDEGKDCFNKLYQEGDKLYLVNTKRPYLIGKNPRVFNSYNEYLKHAKILSEKSGCPVLSVHKARKIKKKNRKRDDPWESYQRRCNRQIAGHRYVSDFDLHYGEALGLTQKKKKQDTQNNQFHENYDVESCMKDLFMEEHDGIKANSL